MSSNTEKIIKNLQDVSWTLQITEHYNADSDPVLYIEQAISFLESISTTAERIPVILSSQDIEKIQGMANYWKEIFKRESNDFIAVAELGHAMKLIGAMNILLLINVGVTELKKQMEAENIR